MEFRTQNDDDLVTPTPTQTPTTTTTTQSSLPLRPSAFSKPTLSPSSSLLTSRNGTTFTPSDPPNPQSHLYKECLRNHAANIGVHVVDGCGEFMPDLDDPFKCAACGCHRSFHRKELSGDAPASSGSPYYRSGAGIARLPLLLPPPHPAGHHGSPSPHAKAFNMSGFPTSPTGAAMVAFGGANTSGGSGGTTTESSSEGRIDAGLANPGPGARKRFRTKFSAEQKEKMMAFAESVGWRIQKQDEAMVEQFCAEAGVRRQVLKVWMHNNKHVVRRQQMVMEGMSVSSRRENSNELQHQQQLQSPSSVTTTAMHHHHHHHP